MTVELLQMISLISFIVAGVLFLLGIALFFLLEYNKENTLVNDCLCDQSTAPLGHL